MKIGHDPGELAPGACCRRVTEHSRQIFLDKFRRTPCRILDGSGEALLCRFRTKRTGPAGVGVCESQRNHARGVTPVELLREEPAPRKSDDVRTLNARSVQSPRQSRRPVADAEWVRGVLRLAAPRRIPGDHSETIRQLLDLRPPRT